MLDYPPRPRGPLFQFPTSKAPLESPTNGSPRDITLSYLLKAAHKFRGWGCVQLYARVQGPTLSLSYNQGIFAKPVPVALTRTLS